MRVMGDGSWCWVILAVLTNIESVLKLMATMERSHSWAMEHQIGNKLCVEDSYRNHHIQEKYISCRLLENHQ